jgi:2-keto-3-deoxygluconate permease
MLADRFIAGGNGTAGLAASSTAGAAIANPTLIANMIPSFKPVAPAATVLVATSCLVTAIIVPILCGFWAKRMGHVPTDEAGHSTDDTNVENLRQGVEPI